MKYFNITVTDKVATYRKRDGFIVCGNSDYKIYFTFDNEWNGYANKKARFKWNGGYRDVDIVDDIADVPIITNATQVEVGVYVEAISTTTSAVIPCTPSILCGSTKEYLTPEEVSSLEERLLAACKFYRHRYDIRIGQYSSAFADAEFIVFSTSTETLENRDDFLSVLKSALYKIPFTVWLQDNAGFDRVANHIKIKDDNTFQIGYDKKESSELGSITISTYTVNSVEITEA